MKSQSGLTERYLVVPPRLKEYGLAVCALRNSDDKAEHWSLIVHPDCPPDLIYETGKPVIK